MMSYKDYSDLTKDDIRREICLLLIKEWNKYPDYTFGQLVNHLAMELETMPQYILNSDLLKYFLRKERK